MIICPNCGAEIENDITKCPYCGYINEEGAKKKFDSDLKEIRNDIEESKKKPRKALVKGIVSGTKIILITIGIILIIALLLFLELLREMQDKPKELFLSSEEKAYASAYKEVAGKELTEAYEEGDIVRLAAVFDKAYSVDRVNLWGEDHYEAGRAASNYFKLMQALPLLDDGSPDKKKAEEITYYCFYFYYRAYGDDAAPLFDPIREEEIVPIITERLGFTTEEADAMRDEVMDPPYLNRSRLYKVTKKRYKDYH